MECTGKLKSVSKNWISRKWEVTFEINEDITASIDKIRDKLLNLTAKIHREKRSLDANAYAWVLMQKIAEAIHTDKWSVYLMMLERYSPVFTHIIVRPEAVERVKGEWRTVKVLGPIQVNGSSGIQLQCYLAPVPLTLRRWPVLSTESYQSARKWGLRPCRRMKLNE